MAPAIAAFQASSLAVPAVLVLMAFLGTASQYLYRDLEPYPLTTSQIIWANVILACLVISFARACLTDPGHVPEGWVPQPVVVHGEEKKAKGKDEAPKGRQRWCSKCEAPKPARAHHCKTCGRCIPKMDHHCPWLANCVSHTTYPHFLRILIYATVGLCYNQCLLYVRSAVLWDNRKLPSYFGPSASQLFLLFSIIAINSLSLLGVGIMTLRFGQMFGENVTTIETWEIERHETLLRRSRYLGGYLEGPDGMRIRIKKQEFPYDIGIWQNMKQAMGTGNILAWFWPLSASPPNETGLNFPVNGFEDLSVTWPPPDPDRMPRPRRQFNPDEAFTHNGPDVTEPEGIEAFRKRQEEDLKRWNGGAGNAAPGLQKRRPFHKRFERSAASGPEDSGTSGDDDGSDDEPGEEAWRNSEGERLADFGVDEEAEFYDDDVPLSELVRRKRMA